MTNDRVRVEQSVFFFILLAIFRELEEASDTEPGKQLNSLFGSAVSECFAVLDFKRKQKLYRRAERLGRDINALICMKDKNYNFFVILCVLRRMIEENRISVPDRCSRAFALEIAFKMTENVSTSFPEENLTDDINNAMEIALKDNRFPILTNK